MQEIARLGGKLHDDLANFCADLAEVGKALEKAQEAHGSAVKKLSEKKGNILGTADKLRELGAKTGIRVVAAGLDQDYLGQPFGPIPHLLAIADMVTKQYAVCVLCGAPATKSQRVWANHQKTPSGEKILVGAHDAYEARCRGCHVRGVDKAVVVASHENETTVV